MARAGGVHPPAYRRCACVIQKDIASNVERGMRKLMDAAVIKSSPLSDCLDKDLWITASKERFLAHLRHVAVRQPPSWYFKVTTDADLMAAWLANMAVEGKEILDADAVESIQLSIEHLRLVDLAEPPDLLVIRLGVKAAKNTSMPDVLQETLNLREHLGKPTWVWDTPDRPLAEGHRCWSPEIEDSMSTWTRQALGGGNPFAVMTLAGTGTSLSARQQQTQAQPTPQPAPAPLSRETKPSREEEPPELDELMKNLGGKPKAGKKTWKGNA